MTVRSQSPIDDRCLRCGAMCRDQPVRCSTTRHRQSVSRTRRMHPAARITRCCQHSIWAAFLRRCSTRADASPFPAADATPEDLPAPPFQEPETRRPVHRRHRSVRSWTNQMQMTRALFALLRFARPWTVARNLSSQRTPHACAIRYVPPPQSQTTPPAYRACRSARLRVPLCDDDGGPVAPTHQYPVNGRW